MDRRTSTPVQCEPFFLLCLLDPWKFMKPCLISMCDRWSVISNLWKTGESPSSFLFDWLETLYERERGGGIRTGHHNSEIVPVVTTETPDHCRPSYAIIGDLNVLCTTSHFSGLGSPSEIKEGSDFALFELKQTHTGSHTVHLKLFRELSRSPIKLRDMLSVSFLSSNGNGHDIVVRCTSIGKFVSRIFFWGA